MGTESRDPTEADKELMDKLSKQAYTGKEIAEMLGITQQGSINKMNKLVTKNIVVRRKYQGVNRYYVEL